MKDYLKDLIKTDKEFSKLSKTKGAAYAFSQYLTQDSIMLPQNKDPVFGIKAIYDSMKASGHGDTLKWVPKGGKVAQAEDMGYTWGIYTLILSKGRVIKGKYLNIWVKQKDSSWKVEVDMGNTS